MKHQMEVSEQEKGRDRSEEIFNIKKEDNFPELKCYDFSIPNRIK